MKTSFTQGIGKPARLGTLPSRNIYELFAGIVNWWLADRKLKSYSSNVATLVDTGMSIDLVWVAICQPRS